MKILKTGDPCPCCGQPIKTQDKKIPQMLGWVWDNGRLPNMQEIKEMEERSV